MSEQLLFWMDVIGTIAFAVSGAMVGIHKKMDIFGVNILAITTAVGGGVLRDIILGMTPPMMFQNPLYVILAVVVATTVFFWLYFRRKGALKQVGSLRQTLFYEKIIFWFDTLGLAAFGINGVSFGMLSNYADNFFLVVFLGVVTGVGGGLLRDIMANEMPYIFVKHIYALASIVGCIVTAFLWEHVGENTGIVAGFAVTVLIRVLAAHYRLNLPRVEDMSEGK